MLNKLIDFFVLVWLRKCLLKVRKNVQNPTDCFKILTFFARILMLKMFIYVRSFALTGFAQGQNC